MNEILCPLCRNNKPTGAEPPGLLLSNDKKTTTLTGIVRIILTLAEKDLKKSLLAALFLILFVGELGCHVAICVNHSSGDRQSIVSNRDGHDDPCKYLVLCSDGTRKDQQVPGFSHDITPYNALFDRLPDFQLLIDVRKKPRAQFPETSRIFQPTSPPFHPPELLA